MCKILKKIWQYNVLKMANIDKFDIIGQTQRILKSMKNIHKHLENIQKHLENIQKHLENKQGLSCAKLSYVRSYV